MRQQRPRALRYHDPEFVEQAPHLQRLHRANLDQLLADPMQAQDPLLLVSTREHSKHLLPDVDLVMKRLADDPLIQAVTALRFPDVAP